MDTDWVKKCMEYEVEGYRQEVDQRGLGQRLCKKDCQARELNREDAMDRSRWKKLISEWVYVSSGTGSPG